MAESMIERVVRAIKEAPTRNGKFEDFIHDDEAANLAQAVLAAMYGPTLQMIRSASYGLGIDEEAALMAWDKMIETALAEQA